MASLVVTKCAGNVIFINSSRNYFDYDKPPARGSLSGANNYYVIVQEVYKVR